MSSPWGKIETIESMSFAEIMSEEYANEVQKKEFQKYEQLQREQQKNAKIATSENKQDCQINIAASEGGDFYEDYENKNDVNMYQKESKGEVYESDALIAQMMQSDYDHEYNEEVRRLEKQRNQSSKVTVSLKNFLLNGDLEFSSDESDQEDQDYDGAQDWDRFETNERRFEAIPKAGYRIEKNGVMITKHDDRICGVRNACKVMSFPPEFSTGDGAGFDMRLSNKVYNQLRAFSKKTRKYKGYERKESDITFGAGIDKTVCYALYKLINNQVLEEVNGTISTGKEGTIMHAISDPNYTGDRILPKECAIKIYRKNNNSFKHRDSYIKDDYRFKDRCNKTSSQLITKLWAEKEMFNLIRMRDAGINCPSVIMLKSGALIMSFIGENKEAAPKLKDAQLTPSQLEMAYKDVVQTMHTLYHVANLVHADLSPYNILWHQGKCWYIDVAQSVEPDSPNALKFLMRDCANIVNFFSKRGVPNVYTKEQLFESITSLSTDKYNLEDLERIHTRGESVKQATAPNRDEVPAAFKPVDFPFDMAWEKSQQDKRVTGGKPHQIIEVTEVLKVLNISREEDEINDVKEPAADDVKEAGNNVVKEAAVKPS